MNALKDAGLSRLFSKVRIRSDHPSASSAFEWHAANYLHTCPSNLWLSLPSCLKMHFHSRLSALLGLFHLISPLSAAENSSYFNLNSAFGLLGSDLPAQLLDLPVGTCNAETPCVNGACCSGVSTVRIPPNPTGPRVFCCCGEDISDFGFSL